MGTAEGIVAGVGHLLMLRMGDFIAVSRQRRYFSDPNHYDKDRSAVLDA